MGHSRYLKCPDGILVGPVHVDLKDFSFHALIKSAEVSTVRCFKDQ